MSGIVIQYQASSFMLLMLLSCLASNAVGQSTTTTEVDTVAFPDQIHQHDPNALNRTSVKDGVKSGQQVTAPGASTMVEVPVTTEKRVLKCTRIERKVVPIESKKHK